MADSTIDKIRSRLAPLEAIDIEIIDDSAAHRGHAGAASGGGHYRLRLISARFTGQSKLMRHRLVYDHLADLMKREIHALTMNLVAPGEVEGAPLTGSADIQHSSGR